jgi:hypothetical protein
VTALLERSVAPVVARRAVTWRQVFRNSVVVPLVVTAPVIGVGLIGDHRYNVFWHGATVQARPWELVTDNLRSVPMYISFGNFRPLGRMLEWAVDTLAFSLAEVLHVPVTVTLHLLSALAAGVLVAAIVLLAQAVTAKGPLFAEPPSRTVALLPFLAGTMLTAAGAVSTTVLFGGLYFLSTALVLAVVAWICREPRSVALVIAAGAILAVTNEMAALAPPLATVAVLARGARRRPAVLLWLGFLPIFLPVRVLIWAACRGGGCYRNSELVLGRPAIETVPNRLTAWLPPLQWYSALHGGGRLSLLVAAVAVLLLGVAAAGLFVRLPAAPRLDRRQAVTLVVTGAAALLLGTALGSVNVQPQEMAASGGWGAGWRDSPLTLAGGALLTAGLLTLVAGALVARTALAVLVLAGAVSTAASHAFTLREDQGAIAVVTAQISDEVAHFDTSPAGDARRCDLLAQFGVLTRHSGYSHIAVGELPQTHSTLDRMRVTADMATEEMYGQRFCRSAG